MEPVTAQFIERVDHYIQLLIGPPDEALLEGSEAAGHPSPNISPNQGKLLYLVARIARAQHVLEIGTLGGYSTHEPRRAAPV